MVEPSFQGVNGLFVLAFENDTQRTSHSGYYLPNVEIKDYNIMISGENLFDQPIKNNKVTYENVRKIATGSGDDYTTGCLFDYPYFKDTYKMTAIDLSKQQALDADPRANQQINFSWQHKNLLHSRRSKRNYSRLFTRNCKSIVNILRNILQNNF